MKIYILIHTQRGLISEPEIFLSKKDVLKKYKELKKNINPDYDEVEWFEHFTPTLFQGEWVFSHK